MLNKYAKFHGDSLSSKKVLARAIELSETADLVYNFLQKPNTSEQPSVAYLTNFYFECFYAIFNLDVRLLLYASIPWCKKSQK